MDKLSMDQTPISVIIPAYNEEETIGTVIRSVIRHPLVHEIIVVDDGSTDSTARIARAAGACVFSNIENQGKGFAMDRGALLSRKSIICFLDADVCGLTKEKLDAIILPVLSGAYGMCVGVRGRKTYWLNKILRLTPILGGERVMRKNIWQSIPVLCKKNFQIEIAMNYYVKAYGNRMGFMLLPNLTHVTKEKKRGLATGILERARMCADILSISVRLYIFDALGRRLRKTYAHPRAQSL